MVSSVPALHRCLFGVMSINVLFLSDAYLVCSAALFELLHCMCMWFSDDPDPEGQGFCQAGFSVDFTKVKIIHYRHGN